MLENVPKMSRPENAALVHLSGSALSLEPLEPHIMRRDAFFEKALGGNI